MGADTPWVDRAGKLARENEALREAVRLRMPLRTGWCSLPSSCSNILLPPFFLRPAPPLPPADVAA